MLHQWVLLVSAVIVVLSYSEHRVHAQFFGRGIGFQKRNPFKPHFGFHRKPHLGWVLAANPNAHEDDDDQAIKSRSAGEAGYDDDALQVVHFGDHVEELHDLGLEPSALIGFFNEDGTVGEWPLVEAHDGAEEMVGRKHGKLDCDDVFGRHSKKKRKFCRKMAAYNEDHGYDHHDDYGHHDSYGNGGHKHHGHHKHHGGHGRYKRQLPSYLPNLPVQQLPLGPLTQSVPNPLQQFPVPQLPPLPRSSRAAYRRYKRNLPYLGNPPLPLGQLPLGTPPLEQSVPVSSTVQLLPVQHITQVDRPRLIRNSPNPDPTPLQRLAQVKFLDANGSEMLAPYQLQSHHHEQHVCPAGTVANYNFFHFSCPPSVVSIDGGAALRNHPKRYIDTNAWSQFPHRIEKRKGVELEQLAQAPVNVERVFSLTTTETVPEVSTTEASRTTESAAKESLRKPPRRKTLPTRSNKIFQRKLIQWRLQNIRDKADETTLEPIVVLSSRESVEEGAPVNRLRDTRDSNVHPISVIEMGDETGEDRLRSRPRPHSNRGEQFLNRLFAPAVPHPSPFDPPKRAAPQSTPSRNNRRGEKLVSRYLKARQPTTTTTVRTTTTPEPTTTTTTTTLRTTLTSKRFPHNKPNTDDASRRRTRYRLRPKKSIQDDEYETFGRNTLQTDPIVSRKAEPTKRRPVPPRRPFRLGKIKPLKVKQQPAREPAVTESLVKQGRWEEIFAIKTNENQRNHPRRSVVDAGEPQEVGQQDARWRLKRAQQFIRRQLRNWRTADQGEVTTTTTTSTTTTTARPLLKEGEDRRHRRPVRPVGRQGRQRSESSEVVNLGRYDVNGQLQAASSNQEGVLSPKVREYIASKVKEACDRCTPSNEIVRSMNNCVPRPSRADHAGTRSKNSVYCEPRERSVRTSTQPSTAPSFGASPLRNLFKWDLFKPWRNLLTAPTS